MMYAPFIPKIGYLNPAYFGGYTNGCTGYFLTKEEYDKCSYEVYWSMLIYYIMAGWPPLNRNSAAKLIEAAVTNAPHSWKHTAKQENE